MAHRLVKRDTSSHLPPGSIAELSPRSLPSLSSLPSTLRAPLKPASRSASDAGLTIVQEQSRLQTGGSPRVATGPEWTVSPACPGVPGGRVENTSTEESEEREGNEGLSPSPTDERRQRERQVTSLATDAMAPAERLIRTRITNRQPQTMKELSVNTDRGDSLHGGSRC